MKDLTKFKANRIRKRFKINGMDAPREFIYVGPLYVNEPEMVDEENPKIHFATSPVSNEEFVLSFKMNESGLFVEESTGIEFSFTGNVSNYVEKPLDADVLPFVQNYSKHPLCIDMNNAIKLNKKTKKLYAKYKGDDEEPFKAKLKEKFAKAANSVDYATKDMIERFFKGTRLEKDFYKEHLRETEFCEYVPEVGELFGYVGKVHAIVPKEFSIDTKDDECSERFKMELKELKDSKYPLFLKKIDEKTAMEVLTGEKFWLNPETLDIVASSTTFKKYSENSLALQTCTFIKPDDFFKLKYAEQGRQEDEFTQWVLEQKVNAKEAFEKGYDEALGEYYANIETAYKLARFDDLVFNLENEDSDRKLKFKK